MFEDEFDGLDFAEENFSPEVMKMIAENDEILLQSGVDIEFEEE